MSVSVPGEGGRREVGRFEDPAPPPPLLWASSPRKGGLNTAGSESGLKDISCLLPACQMQKHFQSK